MQNINQKTLFFYDLSNFLIKNSFKKNIVIAIGIRYKTKNILIYIPQNMSKDKENWILKKLNTSEYFETSTYQLFLKNHYNLPNKYKYKIINNTIYIDNYNKINLIDAMEQNEDFYNYKLIQDEFLTKKYGLDNTKFTSVAGGFYLKNIDTSIAITGLKPKDDHNFLLTSLNEFVEINKNKDNLKEYNNLRINLEKNIKEIPYIE